jgi:hypothetical protein
VYAWVMLCSADGKNIRFSVTWVELGPLGRLQLMPGPDDKIPDERLSDRDLTARRLNQAMTRLNAIERLHVRVNIDGRGYRIPAGFAQGVGAQRLIDEARPRVDCAKGNTALMRDGRTATGHRLSLWLRCRLTPTPVWETPVRLGDLEIERGVVLAFLEPRMNEELAKFWEWLKLQKLDPPVGRGDALAGEVYRILRGESPLRPMR